MFITKTRAASSHVPARRGRDAGAAAARRDGAGADGARRRRPRSRRRALGFVYVPHGVILNQWTPASAAPASS